MAALSIGHCFHSRNCSTPEVKRKSCSRFLSSTISCQSRLPIDPSSSETDKSKEIKEDKKLLLPQILLSSVAKFGESVKESLSPKQKGDWRDLMLMSLSFAVYVYISQRIVCAYCAWMSMVKQPW